jgi:transposase
MGRHKLHRVNLSEDERNHLANLLSSGVEKARRLTRARILLKAADGWSDAQIEAALDVSRPTIERIRKRYAAEGLTTALQDQPRQRHYRTKVDGNSEAHLIALACSAPPAGYARWSLRLLAQEVVRLEQVDLDQVSHETVRQVLKKMNLNPGNTSSG